MCVLSGTYDAMAVTQGAQGEQFRLFSEYAAFRASEIGIDYVVE